MNYGWVENPVWSIFIFGDVQLKHDRMSLKKKKLDSRTICCYFVGYSEKSWGFKFYDPSSRCIFETGNAHFCEDIEFDGGNKVRDTNFQKEHDDSVNIEGNLILSCVQADVSRPSASYS